MRSTFAQPRSRASVVLSWIAVLAILAFATAITNAAPRPTTTPSPLTAGAGGVALER